jgi:hypothetical protein
MVCISNAIAYRRGRAASPATRRRGSTT